jgi:hypothetical protein
MQNDEEPDARIFSVDSRFEKLARRPGGVPREEAIERAQEMIEGLKPGFSEWLDQELTALGALIQQGGADDYDAAWSDAAYQRCHRIRDVGTTMGFDLVTFVANNLCEIFDAIHAGGEYRADLVDCHIQALLFARQERYRNLRPEQLPELSSGLRRVVEYVPKEHAPK